MATTLTPEGSTARSLGWGWDDRGGHGRGGRVAATIAGAGEDLGAGDLVRASAVQGSAGLVVDADGDTRVVALIGAREADRLGTDGRARTGDADPMG